MNCRFCNKECKNSNSLRNHERLCKLNPNRQLTPYEKYGPTKNFNQKGRVAWNKGLTKETDDRVAKSSESIKKFFIDHKDTIQRKKWSDESRAKLSASMKRIYSINPPKVAGRSKRGNYKGFYCRSSWELAYVIYNLEHDINFVANKKGFEYIWEDSIHTYFPDFYLPDTDTYVEIKGYYDKKAQEKTRQFKGNLIVMQITELRPYLEYVINKYGNDFIKLYEE